MSKLIEPITGWEIFVHAMPVLGGDEPLTFFLSQGYPNKLLLNIKDFTGMGFVYEMDSPPSFMLTTEGYGLPQPMNYNKPMTIFLKAAPNSTLIKLDKGMQTAQDLYAGMCFTKVDALTFIELKETVNVQAIKEALETQQG